MQTFNFVRGECSNLLIQTFNFVRGKCSNLLVQTFNSGLAAVQLLLAVPQSLCAYPSSRKVRFHLEDRYAYEQSRHFLELGLGPRHGCPGTDPSFPQPKGTI